MKTFEQYLQEQHAKDYTGTDDDMPDAFNNWLDTLDQFEIIAYAEEWGKILYTTHLKEKLLFKGGE